MTKSLPIIRADQERLDESVHALVGSKLIGVRYRMAPGSLWVHQPTPDGAHEVDWDVVLHLGAQRLAVVGWSMDGFIEGLSLRLGSSDQVAPAMEEVDVTGSPEWRPLLEQPIVAVQTAWHVPNEGCPETLCGIRLIMGSRASVAISLGEIDNGKLRYQPDALVVLFDEEQATEYLSMPRSEPQRAPNAVN